MRIDIPFRTFLRALAVVAAVWLWWRLWHWALVFLLGAFIAVALEPAVRRLQRRGLPRLWAVVLVLGALVLALTGFAVSSWASVMTEARELGIRLAEFQAELARRLPVDLQPTASSFTPSPATLAWLGGAVLDGLGALGIALVVTAYLLVEGRRTYAWVAAFVPAPLRPRVDETATHACEVVAGYVRGNVITSGLAAAATWLALALLGVPLALVLALLAGLLNFVPVIGIYVSAGPAILLALAVSPATAVAVAAFFLLYNLLENVYLQPLVYGRELPLSGLAVIAAFLVGAELGGVLGALVALPVAALYPAVERLWLTSAVPDDTVAVHRRLERDEPEREAVRARRPAAGASSRARP